MEMNLREIVESLLLKQKLSDLQYEAAKLSAERKQKRIYEMTKRPQVLDLFYLAQLVKEACIEQAFMQACNCR